MTEPTPHYERLERLAELVADLPEDSIDLTTWGYGQPVRDVISWALDSPWFQGQGLKPTGPGMFSQTRPSYINSDGLEVYGWRAVEEFFGLTPGQCNTLFSPTAYGGERVPAPWAVADRILAFVNNPDELEPT